MKSSQRQEIADKLSKKIAQMQNRRVEEQTGKEALHTLLDLDVIVSKSLEVKKQVVLYLKDNLTGVERNWTKYPNEIHDIMTERLEKEAESVLYIYLWRQSWGYGKNYCRTSYLAIMQDTVISSRNTARRALASLLERHFVVKALDLMGKQDITQEGALYRILTPSEIKSGVTEEGVLLSDIPKEGVPTQGMPHKGTALPGHSTMSGPGMPPESTPSRIADTVIADVNHALTGHTLREHPLKDSKDILKDSLSPRAITSSFYKGIGQEKISEEKRERAEKDLKELLNDGFSPEDIQFAVKWTLKNAKEELYDFSIVKHTIGQAMASRKKVEAEKAKRREREKAAAQNEADEKRRAEEEERVKAYKLTLSSEERQALHDRAKDEIRSSGLYKEDFITDYLVEIKENELIRAQLGMKT